MIHENDCVNTCAEAEKESFYDIQCMIIDYLSDAKLNLDRIREVVEGLEPQPKADCGLAKEQTPSRRFDRNEYSNMRVILNEALLTTDYAHSLAYRLERYFPREEK